MITTIGDQLMKRDKENLPDTLQKNSPALQAIVNRWKSFEAFAKDYTPDIQSKCARNAIQCYISEKAPSLRQLELVYGADKAESWLEIQLEDLSYFAGARDKITPRQREQTAQIICAHYGWLNAAEIQLFFARLKAGMYGKFYGAVDPMTITDAIKDFLKQRNIELDAYEREKAVIEADGRKKILNGYEEYKKLKKRADEGDEDAIRMLQPPK